MIRLDNIHSMTDFQRNPKGVLEQLKLSKSPAVLTVNGRPEFVVQDATSYQAMTDMIALLEGRIDSLTGRTEPAEDVFKRMEAKHGIQDRIRTAS